MPPHALRLSTYAELDAYVRAFAAGHAEPKDKPTDKPKAKD